MIDSFYLTLSPLIPRRQFTDHTFIQHQVSRAFPQLQPWLNRKYIITYCRGEMSQFFMKMAPQTTYQIAAFTITRGLPTKTESFTNHVSRISLSIAMFIMFLCRVTT